MKKMLIGLIMVTSISTFAQIQKQLESSCPEGTILDSYTVVASDSSGNVVSTYNQSYCKEVEVNVQQASKCPKGTVNDVLTEIAKDKEGNVLSTRFQSYCRELK